MKVIQIAIFNSKPLYRTGQEHNHMPKLHVDILNIFYWSEKLRDFWLVPTIYSIYLRLSRNAPNKTKSLLKAFFERIHISNLRNL